jgi:uncharacterized protein (DUF1499 family)
MFKFSGKRPTNLGAKGGKLAPVVNKPNNVSSQADPSDRGHHVAPLTYSGDGAAALKKMAGIVAAQPGARIVKQDANYLYAEFETPLMGFVDDVEFLVAPGALHVRSASRLGYSDMGVNRKRVEALRAAFSG